ncbi:MAG: system nitrogen-regulatory protein PtsN [Microvirga sp.]|jgi:PTS system nitrogen regulatory IIA component|nr:system nitrogen-regulatory protein PtsN [Microvirga sp.]
MDMSIFLRLDNVVTDLRVTNKDALLRDLAKRAAAFLSLDAKTISQALIAREGLGSTGMGDGVAIPHARLEGISEPFGMLVRLKRPVEFDAVDGAQVDVFFLLLLPLSSEGGGQLNILACAARRVRADGVAQAIRRAPDAAAIYDLMARPGERP